jgi:hypothetical protein
VRASEEKLRNEEKAAESAALKRAHVQVGGAGVLVRERERVCVCVCVRVCV